MIVMNIFMHLHMGIDIYHSLLISEKSKISRLAYVFGCIFPDLAPHLSKYSHDIDNTLKYVITWTEKAMDLGQEPIQKGFLLGKSSHFVMDYFCKYHAIEPYSKRALIEHISYENNLYIKYIRNKSDIDLMKVESIIDENKAHGLLRNGVTLKVRLFSQLHRYINDSKVENVDIVYAYTMNQMLIKDILKLQINEPIIDERFLTNPVQEDSIDLLLNR